MPNQMSDFRDGGPTFFMHQFGLFHTNRTVLQPGHAVRRETLSLSKGRSTSCGYAAYLVTMCGFWRKNVELCRRIFVEKGEYTGDDPLLYSKRHDGE